MSRILVIDDERVIRELMREILAHAGHETVGAETAADALELLDDPDISLIVSDIVMPGLTGLELLDEVRKRRPSLPVVLVTGAGTYENLSQAVARGAQGLVIKPFSHADLQGAVASALEHPAQAERDARERLLRGRQWDPAVVDVLVDLLEAGEIRFEEDGVRNVLLVLDRDEQETLATVAAIEGAAADVRVVRAPDATSAAELCRTSRCALAVVEHDLRDENGRDVLQRLLERSPALRVVVLTSEGSEDAIEAFRRGAADYVTRSNGYLNELAERVRGFLETT